jgi:hypothetical protein
MSRGPRYTGSNPSSKEALMADNYFPERNDPAAECARAFQQVGPVLGELVLAIQLLRDFRARLHQGAPAADIPWDALESVIQELASALQEFHHSIRELEETLSFPSRGELLEG